MNSLMYDEVWQTVFRRFFCPDTQLFYDFVIDDDHCAWHHLPSVDEVRASIPNPCGWGTGMEDSTLNGGSVLDALVAAYTVTGDERIRPWTDEVFAGLVRCASCEGEPGFVARSISPYDGKSHYMESSRDQYTHWVYGTLKLYDSPLCGKAQRDAIRRILTEIAEKCLRDVVPEKDYHLTRTDGNAGLVGKMWGGVGTHEAMRLPMFYLAAYHVTGEERFLGKYLEYRDEGLAISAAHQPTAMRCYCSLQMQCSLRIVYDYDDDVQVREKVLAIMQKNAQYGQAKSIQNSQAYCRPERQDDINFRFRKWNAVEPRNMGYHNGFHYINPAQSERKDNCAFYPVREVAEGAIMAAICPDFSASNELLAAVENMTACIDLKRHSSIYAPLLLACAHILCRENRMAEGAL